MCCVVKFNSVFFGGRNPNDWFTLINLWHGYLTLWGCRKGRDMQSVLPTSRQRQEGELIFLSRALNLFTISVILRRYFVLFPSGMIAGLDSKLINYTFQLGEVSRTLPYSRPTTLFAAIS